MGLEKEMGEMVLFTMQGKIKIGILLIVIFIAVSAGIAAGFVYSLKSDLPSVDFLKKQQHFNGTKVYADDGELIGEFNIEKGIYVPLKDIPNSLKNAVITIEDSRFYEHKGLDYIAIARAAIKDILAFRIKEGGSTITQQLAKVVFLTPEKSIKRKIKEAYLAIRMEKILTKNQILELYLNKIYFGHGAYGIEMASRTYFGKSVDSLSTAEAALLAGLIKAPAIYSPYNDLEKARFRQFTVLERMESEGFLKKGMAKRLWEQPIRFVNLRKRDDDNQYFLEHIRRYLEDKYGSETVYKGGLRVYTTLDRRMQRIAIKSLQEGLREIDKRHGYRGPIEHLDVIKEKKKTADKAIHSVIMTPGEIFNGTIIKVTKDYAMVRGRGIVGRIALEDMLWAGRVLTNREKIKEYKELKVSDILKKGDVVKVRLKSRSQKGASFSLEQEPAVEGAIVIIEPSTGYIKAMVGGYDFRRSEYNRALFARRQAGSAFKPIIYAVAMERGFMPSSIIVDEPVTYDETAFRAGWSPENYDKKYYGPTMLRTALAYSRNVVTVRLLEKIGVDSVIDFSKRLGISGPFERDLTIALGSCDVTPLELTLAYSAFANGGVKMKPLTIKYISDSKDNILETSQPEGQEVMSKDASFLITNMMEDVVKYGTGWRAKSLGRAVAGKTGTTNEYRDAWFIGYTPEIVAGVWIGFDNRQPLGPGETGARAASPIWVSLMREILETIPPSNFAVPDGIIAAEVDAETGLLATNESRVRYIEYFKKGSLPGYSTSDAKERLGIKTIGDFPYSPIKDQQLDID